MTASPSFDLQTAYEHAEAQRIHVAAELASVRQTLRRERALHAHPVLTAELLDLVGGESDEDYGERASALAAAILNARLDVPAAGSS